MHRQTKGFVLAAMLLLGGSAGLYGSLGGASPASAQPQASPPAMPIAQAEPGRIVAANLADLCQPAAMQAIAARLSIKVTVRQLPANVQPGPFLTGGTRFTPATATRPAYCQVTGSYVTNPATGKTASFLATLPMAWNRKYLQLGCGGHCGTFAVSDAASPTITITNQGLPGDSLKRGYASFATDEGHGGFHQGKWAIKGPGRIDHDALDDFLYRSQKVLATMGKEFTTALYAQATGTSHRIAYSYFCGCSGGGRDALVAASYFPEEFDGIIAGSAYANMANLAFLSTGSSLASVRSPGAQVPKALMAQMNAIVMARCDAVDGVKDGLIQNPMACDFRPEKDLPRCAGDVAGEHCFTKAQIETVSTMLTAATDRAGRVVQPGYSISEMQNPLILPPEHPGTANPWDDSGNPATGGSAGIALLGDAVIRVFAHENDPNFSTPSIISYGAGGRGPVNGFRVIVPAAEVAKVNAALRMGIGDIPQNAARLIRLDRKLLIWANLSDQLLTPYMSINYYKRLARMYGGYARLQNNVRLFGLPGTAHCSGGGIGQGPGSFDALAAMEAWVEKRQAPDALTATLYEANQYGVDFGKPSGRTMPLCKFPEMAHYSGRGDVRDGANWSCRPGDTGMLAIGESGRQAGVVN